MSPGQGQVRVSFTALGPTMGQDRAPGARRKHAPAQHTPAPRDAPPAQKASSTCELKAERRSLVLPAASWKLTQHVSLHKPRLRALGLRITRELGKHCQGQAPHDPGVLSRGVDWAAPGRAMGGPGASLASPHPAVLNLCTSRDPGLPREPAPTHPGPFSHFS